MRFTVTWTEEAKAELCKLYLAVDHKRELSQFVNALELDLARLPNELGESRGDNSRVVMESHFGVLYEVHNDDCLVKVFHIGWLK